MRSQLTCKPWYIDNLKGYTDGVKDQLKCNETIPSAARDYLLRLIDETVPIPLMLTINAGGHEVLNNATGRVTRHILITLTAITAFGGLAIGGASSASP